MSDLVRIHNVDFLMLPLKYKRCLWNCNRVSQAAIIFQERISRCCQQLAEAIWAATWENRIFAYAKTKTQISFAVTAKLISAFVFATRIVQSLFFLNTKFQASSHLLRLHSPVCVGPGRKPRRPVFWRCGSYIASTPSTRSNIATTKQQLIKKTCKKMTA